MLHYNTVVPELHAALIKVMTAPKFDRFRLVGGTALSLHCGHRMSIDIDLFTDADYGSIDFAAIDKWLHHHFSYVNTSAIDIIKMGKSYFIDSSPHNSIKLDLYYTDPFIDNAIENDGIRLALISL